MASSSRVRSVSGSPEPSAGTTEKFQPKNKHLMTPLEIQKVQLERLMANPDRSVHLPGGPKEKTQRAPREMMKNVQGSSAGAGSGEFHVYKQNRRREYERLKMMDEKAKEEEEAAAFAARQNERISAADAKTAKNRAKRLKRKGKPLDAAASSSGANGGVGGGSVGDAGGKKRKLGVGVAGGAVMFRKPGEESDEDEEESRPSGRVGQAGSEDDEDVGPSATGTAVDSETAEPVKVVEESGNIVIHDDY